MGILIQELLGNKGILFEYWKYFLWDRMEENDGCVYEGKSFKRNFFVLGIYKLDRLRSYEIRSWSRVIWSCISNYQWCAKNNAWMLP